MLIRLNETREKKCLCEGATSERDELYETIALYEHNGLSTTYLHDCASNSKDFFI